MIKLLSCKIASNIGRQLQSSTEEVEVYAYGLQTFLNNVLELILLFLLAWGLGLLTPAFLVLTAFALIRVPGGGAHLKTFPRCLIAGLIVILGLAKLSQLMAWNIQTGLFAVIVLTVAGLGIVKAWVPAGTEKKRVTAPAEIKQQKRITFFTLLVNSLLAAGCLNSGYAHEANAIILGMFCGLWVITPWGYMLFHTLDHGMDLIERRCSM